MADEIKVGAVAPLSGAQALLGISLQNGMKMYFNEVNAKGGVNGHTFSLVQGDDKGDPREGTLVGQKFCDDDQILALLGHLNSGVQLAALPIYQGCGMPEVVLGSNPTITEQGAENIVRPTANDFEQAGLAATYALQTQKATTAAVVNDKQAFGQGVAKLFEAKYKAGGGTVVGSSAVNPTDIDFTAVITQIKAKNPGVVYFGAVMPQLALFAKQMKEQGLDAKLLVPDGAYTPDFIKQAGAAAAENTLITFPLPPADSNIKLVQFGEDYKRMFNEAPGPYSAYGYIAAQVVVKAIAQTGAKPSRETILPKLKEVKIDTILGSIQFKPNGDMTTAPMHLYKVEGDAFKLVSSNQ
jgi:branched-chain amino acid transport system substrate-binding protein